MCVYLLSTAVAPLGSGLGGGVESMIVAAARQLLAQGHAVQVIAPVGSIANLPNLLTIPGSLAPTAVGRHYDDPMPIAADSFLVAVLRRLAQQVRPGDVILNFSYDWLPLFLSDILPCPLGTLVSMGSLNRALDQEIRYQFTQRPPRLAFLSHAQAASFGIEEPVRCIPPGLDLTQYHYNAQPGQTLGWMGRIAPEKGLEDAFTLAARTGIDVTVLGVMQDPVYWNGLIEHYPDAPVRYAGFLNMPALAEAVRQFRGLLMTPKWLEALGIVGIEALACGTPVIAYQRGGMSDYVRDGETGWLVEPNDLDGLIGAVDRIDQIDRARCRAWVESHYTLAHYGTALNDWLRALAAPSMDSRGRI